MIIVEFWKIKEFWKEISGWPYEVSSAGRVRPLGKSPLKLFAAPNGYYSVSLWRTRSVGGPYPNKRQFLVHRLVAEALVGDRPSGLVINHKDGNKQNNRCENLEYVSRSRNIKHSFEMGLSRKGSRHHAAKLDENKVRLIRRLFTCGVKGDVIARLFSISESVVYNVKNRKGWAHIADETVSEIALRFLRERQLVL